MFLKRKRARTGAGINEKEPRARCYIAANKPQRREYAAL